MTYHFPGSRLKIKFGQVEYRSVASTAGPVKYSNDTVVLPQILATVVSASCTLFSVWGGCSSKADGRNMVVGVMTILGSVFSSHQRNDHFPTDQESQLISIFES